ncbi:MAG: helix-turn-helix domain-containing protein [Candidatus Heimdallarchaeota archaeon]
MSDISKEDLITLLKKEYVKKEKPKRRFPKKLIDQENSCQITNEIDEIVFCILKKHGPVTRSKLVEITGLPRTTLYDSLVRLILKNHVRKFDEERNQRGRPKVFYRLA